MVGYRTECEIIEVSRLLSPLELLKVALRGGRRVSSWSTRMVVDGVLNPS